jgi:hypothetical protein
MKGQMVSIALDMLTFSMSDFRSRYLRSKSRGDEGASARRLRAYTLFLTVMLDSLLSIAPESQVWHKSGGARLAKSPRTL